METIYGVSRDVDRRDGTTEIASEADREPCGYCRAPAGELCVNLLTGRTTRIPHPCRHHAASRPLVGAGSLLTA